MGREVGIGNMASEEGEGHCSGRGGCVVQVIS